MFLTALGIVLQIIKVNAILPRYFKSKAIITFLPMDFYMEVMLFGDFE